MARARALQATTRSERNIPISKRHEYSSFFPRTGGQFLVFVRVHLKIKEKKTSFPAFRSYKSLFF